MLKICIQNLSHKYSTDMKGKHNLWIRWVFATGTLSLMDQRLLKSWPDLTMLWKKWTTNSALPQKQEQYWSVRSPLWQLQWKRDQIDEGKFFLLINPFNCRFNQIMLNILYSSLNLNKVIASPLIKKLIVGLKFESNFTGVSVYPFQPQKTITQLP